mmetsp:Transcript_126991/g.179209  ORF Transcript_126991/g.179209 Transcript_126991/m.179209 type:complete len:206 (-) Transcript_126991:1937-2554(-)
MVAAVSFWALPRPGMAPTAATPEALAPLQMLAPLAARLQLCWRWAQHPQKASSGSEVLPSPDTGFWARSLERYSCTSPLLTRSHPGTELHPTRLAPCHRRILHFSWQFCEISQATPSHHRATESGPCTRIESPSLPSASTAPPGPPPLGSVSSPPRDVDTPPPSCAARALRASPLRSCRASPLPVPSRPAGAPLLSHDRSEGGRW